MSSAIASGVVVSRNDVLVSTVARAIVSEAVILGAGLKGGSMR